MKSMALLYYAAALLESLMSEKIIDVGLKES
jgi:hypothetical protein